MNRRNPTVVLLAALVAVVAGAGAVAVAVVLAAHTL
jgi:hypothetical protein